MRFLYENTALFTKNARFAEILAHLGAYPHFHVSFSCLNGCLASICFEGCKASRNRSGSSWRGYILKARQWKRDGGRSRECGRANRLRLLSWITPLLLGIHQISIKYLSNIHQVFFVRWIATFLEKRAKNADTHQILLGVVGHIVEHAFVVSSLRGF